MNGLEDILATHEMVGRVCACNCWPGIESILNSTVPSWMRRREHPAHVAAAVRDWLRAAIDAEKDAVDGRSDPAWNALTSLALELGIDS